MDFCEYLITSDGLPNLSRAARAYRKRVSDADILEYTVGGPRSRTRLVVTPDAYERLIVFHESNRKPRGEGGWLYAFVPVGSDKYFKVGMSRLGPKERMSRYTGLNTVSRVIMTCPCPAVADQERRLKELCADRFGPAAFGTEWFNYPADGDEAVVDVITAVCQAL